MSNNKKIVPQFSYPGGIWFQNECDINHYDLLLNFVLFENIKTPPFIYERQTGGKLIRFKDAEIGMNCFNYVLNN